MMDDLGIEIRGRVSILFGREALAGRGRGNAHLATDESNSTGALSEAGGPQASYLGTARAQRKRFQV